MTSEEIVDQIVPDFLVPSFHNIGQYFVWYEHHYEQSKLCVKGTIGSVLGPIVLTLALTVFQRPLVHAWFLPRFVVNILLIFLGYFAMILWVDNALIVKTALVGSIAVAIYIKFFTNKFSGYGVTALCLVYIIGLQYNMESSDFASSRGCLMILGMKLSSLAFDVSDSTIRQRENFDLLTMISYLISPATITFGPFLTYETHAQSLLPKHLKEELKGIIRSICLLIVCAACLLYSSCGTDLIIATFFPSSGLIKDFATAQSFRFSHYFICFLAQAFAESSGLISAKVSTVNLPSIEFPRSLVEVVVGWNVPMHTYLRIYVYEEAQRWGSVFAIAATFCISSLFHGLNFQLSAVLLSLGFHCFVENKVRNKIARELDACVRTRPCTRCRHSRNSKSAVSIILNVLFAALNMYHLIYLGMVFDGSGAETGYSWQHTIRIWKGHHYVSHLISAVALLIFSIPF